MELSSDICHIILITILLHFLLALHSIIVYNSIILFNITKGKNEMAKIEMFSEQNPKIKIWEVELDKFENSPSSIVFHRTVTTDILRTSTRTYPCKTTARYSRLFNLFFSLGMVARYVHMRENYLCIKLPVR